MNFHIGSVVFTFLQRQIFISHTQEGDYYRLRYLFRNFLNQHQQLTKPIAISPI